MSKAHPLELLIGTHNPGKVREIENGLAGLPLKLRYLREFPLLAPVDESGLTYEQNATIKAQAYSNETGLLALADDSGLEVDALRGAPGLRSARYAGAEASDEDRIRLLLDELARIQSENRSARFRCVVVIANPQLMTVVEGRCEGRVSYAPRGGNGFGFDPIFIPQGFEFPQGFESTFAELSSEVKNRISHRAQALASAREFLSDWLANTDVASSDTH